MPQPRKSLPRYLKHASGKGRIVWTDPSGTRREKPLPGPYNSPESKEAFLGNFGSAQVSVRLFGPDAADVPEPATIATFGLWPSAGWPPGSGGDAKPELLRGRSAGVRGDERLGDPAGGYFPDLEPIVDLLHVVCYLFNAAQALGGEGNRWPLYVTWLRREGLPTTSSLVESLVGEFNARVKGRSKFWNRPDGAEAILQMRPECAQSRS